MSQASQKHSVNVLLLVTTKDVIFSVLQLCCHLIVLISKVTETKNAGAIGLIINVIKNLKSPNYSKLKYLNLFTFYINK